MESRTVPPTVDSDQVMPARSDVPEAGALRVLRSSPVCAETPLERQTGLLTPNHLFYLRNNFPYPDSWPGLRVDSAARRPGLLGLADLERFKSQSLVVTLECAGNGRSTLAPPVEGEQWGLGAVSTAEWSGTPLRELLTEVGVAAGTVEVAFAGADGFARSLPIETAMHPDTLLVTGMNGSPLPPEHGGPLRLLVPGWYGMASVKWLERIAMLSKPFDGHFQVERYVIDGAPVREMEVRAVITEPAEGATIERRAVRVAGYAWTGHGEVTKVELSDDAGVSWMAAELLDAAPPYGWTRWQRTWQPRQTGPTVLYVRATDSAGRLQPQDQRRNRLGYCNNASAPHRLKVSPSEAEEIETDVE